MTRAQQVNLLASTAGLLATTYGEVFATPNGRGAASWSSGPLQAILWADGDDARIDVFHNNRKVLASTWRNGATMHEALAFKRGPWMQALETAGRAMIEGVAAH